MKTIGIVVHSAEGGALCFQTVCREGIQRLGDHMHPRTLVSAIPMGLSMPGWETDQFDEVAQFLTAGIEDVAKAGADFFICPDNTAHIVLEQIEDRFPIPGLHIADAVSKKVLANGWGTVGVLGTEWTMTGPVYKAAFDRRRIHHIVPDPSARRFIHGAIFEELCNGQFYEDTITRFIEVIEKLKSEGADCVLLGCTEIPLIIGEHNSPLPILDSTRLLSSSAVDYALSSGETEGSGWLSD